MFLKGTLLVVLIILSAIFLLISFIFLVIRLADNHPKKWNWLIAVIVSLLILVGSVFFFVRKVMNKVSEVGENIGKQFEQSMGNLQNQSNDYHYELLDSANQNSTLAKIKSFETDSIKAPKEFYVYFGFNDYYRMPLTYPYALHCTDILEKGYLVNEKNVTEFNVSDNGEIECDFKNITSLAFDNKILIAKQMEDIKDNTNVKYIVYDFYSQNKTECGSEKDAFIKARKQFNYNGPDTMVSVLRYYRLFN